MDIPVIKYCIFPFDFKNSHCFISLLTTTSSSINKQLPLRFVGILIIDNFFKNSHLFLSVYVEKIKRGSEMKVAPSLHNLLREGREAMTSLFRSCLLSELHISYSPGPLSGNRFYWANVLYLNSESIS